MWSRWGVKRFPSHSHHLSPISFLLCFPLIFSHPPSFVFSLSLSDPLLFLLSVLGNEKTTTKKCRINGLLLCASRGVEWKWGGREEGRASRRGEDEKTGRKKDVTERSRTGVGVVRLSTRPSSMSPQEAWKRVFVAFTLSSVVISTKYFKV